MVSLDLEKIDGLAAKVTRGNREAARVIVIKSGAWAERKRFSLAHELGHIRADHEHRFTDYATSTACRGQAEVEAESIAYLITAQAGLDSATYSVPYVAGWSGGDVDALRQSMATVLTVARAANGADLVSTTPPAPRSLPRGQLPAPTPAVDPPASVAAR